LAQQVEEHPGDLKGELAIPAVAMAKYSCSERAMKVVDKCVQMHGGYGYMEEYPTARSIRRPRRG